MSDRYYFKFSKKWAKEISVIVIIAGMWFVHALRWSTASPLTWSSQPPVFGSIMVMLRGLCDYGFVAIRKGYCSNNISSNPTTVAAGTEIQLTKLEWKASKNLLDCHQTPSGSQLNFTEGNLPSLSSLAYMRLQTKSGWFLTELWSGLASHLV